MEPIIVVVGFARCGSSLLMSMLDAGGQPVVADSSVSYESELVRGLPEKHRWLASCGGKAVKILEPQYLKPPQGYPYHFIWMNRDLQEQAKSQYAFVSALGIKPNKTPRVLAKSLQRDRPKVIQMLKSYPNSNLLILSFDRLVTQPASSIQKLIKFCPGLDAEKMNSVIIRRSPKCQYLRIEEAKFGQAG